MRRDRVARRARTGVLAGVVLLAVAAAARPALAQPEEGVRVVVKEAPPFAWRDVDGKWAGLAVDLWRRVAEQASLPPSVYEERSLDALLEAVAAGEADVGLGALSVTAEREERFDFTHPFLSTGLGVAVPARGDSLGLWSHLRLLFSRGLGWLIGGLIGGLLIFGVLITLAERRRNPAFKESGRRKAVSVGFWWAVILALGHKGVFPSTVLGRVLAATMMTASLLLLSVFVGAIASVLTVSQLEDQFVGPEDLRRVRVATVRGTTSEAFLVRERIAHRGFDTLDVALDRLVAGRVGAVVYDRPLLLHLAKGRLRDKVRVLPLVFDSQDYAFALASDFPHREAVNRALLQIRGSRWWRQQLFHHLGE